MFFMDIDSFKANFLYFVFSYHKPDYSVNYFDRIGDDGELGYYTFTTTW